MVEIFDDRPEDDKPEPCETCNGTGEVGPFGWEYPEYDTCPDCKGSGVQDDGSYGDLVHDRKRDDTP